MIYKEREFKIGSASELTGPNPILIGIAGETKTGKTYSAMRLATGMAKVTGERFCVIDTEGYAREYKGIFDFDLIDFRPPYSSFDYMAAVNKAVESGRTIIVVDQLSHEHSGPGGYLDQVEQYLDEKCGDDMAARQRHNASAYAHVKPQRDKVSAYLHETARLGVLFILCYRAEEKTRPETGKGIVDRGFLPITTSHLRYDMRASFLLLPGAKGVPTLQSDKHEELLWIELREPFCRWVEPGKPLDEKLGERFARWALDGQKADLSSYVSPFKWRSYRTAIQGTGTKPDYSKDPSPPCRGCGGKTRFVRAGKAKGKKWEAGWGCAEQPSCKERGVKGAWVDATQWHNDMEETRQAVLAALHQKEVPTGGRLASPTPLASSSTESSDAPPPSSLDNPGSVPSSLGRPKEPAPENPISDELELKDSLARYASVSLAEVTAYVDWALRGVRQDPERVLTVLRAIQNLPAVKVKKIILDRQHGQLIS